MAEVDPQASVQPFKTGSKGQTLHSLSTQQALGGYSKGQLVQVDGVIWRSQADGNMSHPGDHNWTLFF